MSEDKNDFYGKDVAEAIKNACDSLGVAQEDLDIEVIETGAAGIFGLIRKKAHIRAVIKPVEETGGNVFEIDLPPESHADQQEPAADIESKDEGSAVLSTAAEDEDDSREGGKKETKKGEEVSGESLEIVKSELLRIVELMGFPSSLDVEVNGVSVVCTLRGDYEANLTGGDGKVLDSLQYIVRKIVSRKVPERLRLSINVGDFREKRIEELKEKAVALATQVKDQGKTQVLSALNPSERRAVHMVLQEDKSIRSRSVGDGLFKKILIYKPNKNSRPAGRKRTQSKGHQKKPAQHRKKRSDS